MTGIIKDRWGTKLDEVIFRLLHTPEGPIAVVKKTAIGKTVWVRDGYIYKDWVPGKLVRAEAYGVFPIVRLENGTEAMFPKRINGMRATCPKEEQHD